MFNMRAKTGNAGMPNQNGQDRSNMDIYCFRMCKLIAQPITSFSIDSTVLFMNHQQLILFANIHQIHGQKYT